MLENLFYKYYRIRPVRPTPTRAATTIQKRWRMRNKRAVLQERIERLGKKMRNERNRLGHSLPNSHPLIKQYNNILKTKRNLSK
jgi:hypothetical protein